ncbi:MAG: hypothetical protein JKX78_12160 [Alteromonadaceae bacterium]|nr:hypothetical protein [Alteromonadaceae bacterium]
MQKFFKDLNAIEQFTTTLKSTPSLQCHYCLKHEHFISHGFVYKQHSTTCREAVGKRIICCNRYGHQGCGRTYQLDISRKLPKRHYSGAVLFAFISLLILGRSVCNAYIQATKQAQTRHAWRWLKQLKVNLMNYRGYLKVPIPVETADRMKHFKHHQLVLTTLTAMLFAVKGCPCAAFQFTQQIAFI